MSSRYLRTPASFWSGLKSRMWMRLMALHRQWRSGRRTRRGIPRSTVATATEIFDYLRLLFARVGRTYCLRCGGEVKKDTVDEVAAAVMALGDGSAAERAVPAARPERKPDRGYTGKRPAEEGFGESA